MAEIKGGNKFQAVLQDMAGKLASAETVKIGFLASATYPDGTPVALVAAFNEFGTSRAPPRPFFRNMIAAKRAEWAPAIAALLEANDYDAARTLELTGQAVAGQLRQSIVETNSPPNSSASSTSTTATPRPATSSLRVDAR